MAIGFGTRIAWPFPQANGVWVSTWIVTGATNGPQVPRPFLLRTPTVPAAIAGRFRVRTPVHLSSQDTGHSKHPRWTTLLTILCSRLAILPLHFSSFEVMGKWVSNMIEKDLKSFTEVCCSQCPILAFMLCSPCGCGGSPWSCAEHGARRQEETWLDIYGAFLECKHPYYYHYCWPIIN